jgi:hypothetical protein
MYHILHDLTVHAQIRSASLLELYKDQVEHETGGACLITNSFLSYAPVSKYHASVYETRSSSITIYVHDTAALPG